MLDTKALRKQLELAEQEKRVWFAEKKNQSELVNTMRMRVSDLQRELDDVRFQAATASATPVAMGGRAGRPTNPGSPSIDDPTQLSPGGVGPSPSDARALQGELTRERAKNRELQYHIDEQADRITQLEKEVHTIRTAERRLQTSLEDARKRGLITTSNATGTLSTPVLTALAAPALTVPALTDSPGPGSRSYSSSSLNTDSRANSSSDVVAEMGSVSVTLGGAAPSRGGLGGLRNKDRDKEKDPAACPRCKEASAREADLTREQGRLKEEIRQLNEDLEDRDASIDLLTKELEDQRRSSTGGDDTDAAYRRRMTSLGPDASHVAGCGPCRVS